MWNRHRFVNNGQFNSVIFASSTDPLPSWMLNDVNEELISARLKLNGSLASDLSLLNNWQEEADCRIIAQVHCMSQWSSGSTLACVAKDSMLESR